MSPYAAYFILSAFLLSAGSVMARGFLTGGFGLAIPVLAPLPFLSCQLAGSVGLLVAIALQRRLAIPAGPALGQLLAAGAIVGFGAIGTIMALAFMPVGEASVIFATQPIAIIVLAWVLLSERTEIATIVLCGVAIIGVILIVTGGEESDGSNHIMGAIFATFSTLAAAIYVVWMRRITVSTNPLAALIAVQAAALSVALAAWMLTALAGLSEESSVAPSAVAAAALSGAIYYGLAFYVYLLGLKHVEAGVAGVFLNLVPVFTISLAYVLLAEMLTEMQWLGSAIALAAVVAVGHTTRLPPTPSKVDSP